MKVCWNWVAETYMIWNVKIVIGQSDAVPAHLVNQVFPENNDLLAAVLDPKKVKEINKFKKIV